MARIKSKTIHNPPVRIRQDMMSALCYAAAMEFVCVYYGLRREEVLGLKWNAIDFKHKKISIQHTVTGSKTLYEENKAKTQGGYRTLNLFPSAEACFKGIQRKQKENQEFFGDIYQDTKNYVFTHEDDTPYRSEYIPRYFSKAMDKSGRPEITLHTVTCVSLLIDKGWDVKKIQYWIGDDDAAAVLNIYAQYMKLQSNMAVDDLSRMSESVADLFK